eukprot:TRINITY_DN10189_c0_g1_i2.p1 TRINITY_DN10189_c0_g1~~TRINITY_DN10189_c0_g1_i2.p1  ORF type:complete len:971 (+),score=287.30 TRINITY_DN10189_c0_g1_i2:157-3069(+)
MAQTETFRANYDFNAKEEDELDLLAGDVIDVAVIHEGEWGVGVSRRTQKEGLFPWSYVEKHTATAQVHQFELIQIVQPTICWHTKEFIWGGGAESEAWRCSVCGFTCRKRAKFFVENERSYDCVRPGRNGITPLSDVALDNWTVDDVRLFLIAAKLDVYEPLFVNGSVTGSKLKTLNHKSLQKLGVEDTAHRTMILACIDELRTGKTKSTENSFSQRCNLALTEPLDPVEKLDSVPFQLFSEDTRNVRRHTFRVKSYANMTWCDYSRKLLFGLARQGLQCTICGYNVSPAYLDEVASCTQTKFPGDAKPAGIDVGHVFGVPVEVITHPGHQAPPLVEKCVAALENGKAFKTSDLYKKNASADKLRTLQAELFTNADASLEGLDPHLLTSLLKRFFIELPDSIIPSEWYDRTIAAAGLPTEDEQVAELDRVMENVRGIRATTLSYLLSHLGRVIINHKGTKMDADSLARVWGPILLRPLPAEGAKAVSDRQLQANAIKLLVAKCKVGGVPTMSSGEAPPLLPRGAGRKSMRKKGSSASFTQSNYENIALPNQTVSRTSAKPQVPSKPSEKIYESVNTMFQQKSSDLTQQPWFAGNCDRNKAEQLLAPLVDGSYLIRSSQTRKGFSLTVKFRELRHIAIKERFGKYGFSDDTCTFPTIPALVKHFEKESLAKYNHILETTLAYPYKQAPKATNDHYDYDEGPDEDIYVSNVSELRKNIKRRQGDWRHDQNAQRIAHFDKQMKERERVLKAQQMVRKMLEEQLKINQAKQATMPEEDTDKVMAQFKDIKTMIADALKMEQDISTELERIAQEDREFREAAENQLQEEPDDGASSAVASMASPPPAVPRPRMSFSQQLQSQSSADDLDNLSTSYFVGPMSRQEAGSLLRSQPPGAFLVRQSDKPDKPYSLSLRYNAEIKHIQIKYDGQKYGLAEPLAFRNVGVSAVMPACNITMLACIHASGVCACDSLYVTDL